MRTSHRSIREKIENEKKKITDEELFASNQYAAYLTDLAEGATKRYKRKIQVKTDWDTSVEASIAYTNNRSIYINAGNRVTQSLPTKRLRAISLIGLVAHEVGHVLFTDFKMTDIYQQSLLAGRFYPEEPTGLTPIQQKSLQEILDYYKDGDQIALRIIAKLAHHILNTIEDGYVEARICDTFPGSFKTGIEIVNYQLVESFPSINKQIANESHGFSIITNLILQYVRSGDMNNLGGYKGEYLDVFYDCLTTIDNAIYDDDAKTSFRATNFLLLNLWKYIKEEIEHMREEMEKGSSSLEELLDKLGEELEEESPSVALTPERTTKPARGKEKWKPSKASKTEEKEDMTGIENVVSYETGRIALEKTEKIETGEDGSVTWDRNFPGSGYVEEAEKDMNRFLNQMAEERAIPAYEEELSEELQEEVEKIRFGNAHRGVNIKVNRMSYVPERMMKSYREVSPPLLVVSKRLQKQVLQLLKDQREGGKVDGLLFGKRFNSRRVIQNDGHYFYNYRLPDDTPKLAIALLVDESGSMSSMDRITAARSTAIVIYDFCKGLGIPVTIFGHTEEQDVELFCYAEFDSIDGKDQYRLMDMSARSGNRDGAALRYVAERLMTREEENKILILISDGQPAASGYYGTEAEADLRGIKQEYTRKGLKLFAAAIGDDKANIERIYKDGFLDVTNLNRLPVNLTKLIASYIGT